MREGAIVKTHFIDAAAEILSPDRIAANAQWISGNPHGTADRTASHLTAVDEHTQGGAVVGGGQMRPGVERNAAATGSGEIAAARVYVSSRPRRVVIGIEGIGKSAGPFFEYDAAPAADAGRIHPSFESHTGRQIEGGGIVDGDHAIAAEGQGIAVSARTRPGGPGDRAIVGAARCIGHCTPAAFVKSICGNKTCRGRLCIRAIDKAKNENNA